MALGDMDAAPGGSIPEVDTEFKQGRTGTLLLFVGLGGLVIAGLLLFMAAGDEQRVFRELGRRINGAKQVSFEGFFGCVLAGDDPRRMHNNAELDSELVARAYEIGPPWVAHFRKACLPLLSDAEHSLEILITPAELKPDVQDMSAALAELRDQAIVFVEYLEDARGAYDEAQLLRLAKGISRPWYRFRAAHGRANQTIKAKLR